MLTNVRIRTRKIKKKILEKEKKERYEQEMLEKKGGNLKVT